MHGESMGEGGEYVYFKVPDLGCGAVEGLGCGSKIIPLLAHLDEVGGARHAATDRSGTLLRVELGNVGLAGQVEAAVAAYGYPARIETSPGTGQMQWYDVNGARELSRVEASTVAQRLAMALDRAGRLEDAERPAFLAAAADGLFDAFVTHEIVPGRAPTVRAAAARNVRRRVASVLGDGLAAAAEELIARSDRPWRSS